MIFQMRSAFWTRALAAMVAGLAVSATGTADVPDVKPDPRIARLETFFRSYHCPAPLHTVEYVRAADSYGLDYRLLPAVSIRETQCGKTERRRHNHWGFHQENFASVEAGIEFLARRLTRHPLYRGKTLEGILFTYNPLPAYPEEVKRIMLQIE